MVIPAAATITSLIALRRIRTSPLGVARRVTPPAPKFRSVLPLLIGIGLFLAVLLPAHPPTSHGANTTAAPSFNLPLALLGFLLIMIGLVTGGSWLTREAARLLSRASSGASGLLASRRLADSPSTAFRAVSGLVLAVFVATTIAVVAATVNAAQTGTPADTQLADVLRLQLGVGQQGPPPPNLVHTKKALAASADGLSVRQTAAVHRRLNSYPGVTAVPIYALPGTSGSFSANDDVVSCASLSALPALGSCPPSATEVELNPMQLMTDNPLYLNKILPLVGRGSPATSINLHRLRLDTLLVKTPDPSTLERVRTYLATDPAVVAATDTAQANAGVVPETFGESAAIRSPRRHQRPTPRARRCTPDADHCKLQPRRDRRRRTTGTATTFHLATPRGHLPRHATAGGSAGISTAASRWRDRRRRRRAGRRNPVHPRRAPRDSAHQPPQRAVLPHDRSRSPDRSWPSSQQHSHSSLE